MSKTFNILAGSVSIYALFLGLPAVGQVQAQGQASGQLEEIVVTAQKKSENLQQVPISITAFSAAALEEERVVDINDLKGLAPNVEIAQGFAAAGAGNATIAIRGIESNTTNVGAQDSAVALYLDGVYLARAVDSVFDLADIERIEVLEGPQGTLYGRNAVGGAVNVITQGPKGEFGVKLDLSGGNLGEFRTKLRVDTPEWAGFSASASFLHSQNDGYVKNAGAGQTWDFRQATNGHFGVYTSPTDLGSSNTNAFLLAVKYQPPALDALTVNYKFDYTESDDVPNGTQITALYAPASTIYSFQPAGFKPIVSYGPTYTVNNPFVTDTPSTVFGHSLTIDYQLNDVMNLKSITAYRFQQITNSSQLDGGNNIMLGGQPYGLLLSAEIVTQHEVSQEIDLNAKLSWLDLTTGIYFFHEGSVNYTSEVVFANLPNHVVPAYDLSQSNQNTNVSVFGQGTLHLLENLDLTGGLRYSNDDRRTTDQVIAGFSGDNVHHRIDWLGELAYHFTPDIMGYGKISSGYISGGFYNGVPFAPETITTAEVGAKADLLDKRLRTNLAGFWSDLRNYQQYSFLPAVCGVAGQCIYNYGAEHLFGGEATISAIPVDHVVLDTNFGLTHQIAQSSPAFVPSVPSIFTPLINLHLGMEYDFDEYLGGQPSFRVEAQYVSDVHWGGIPSTGMDYVTPSHWVVNARATLAEVPVNAATLKVSLWGKNIFDQRSVSYSLANLLSSFGVSTASVAPPATYGIDVSLKF